MTGCSVDVDADADGWTLVAGYQPVMGTHLDLQITAASEAEARAAESVALAESARLESVFTVFDPCSDLCLWRGGAEASPTAELATLLGSAAAWQRRSGGAFNPLTGVLTQRWQRAVDDGIAPPDEELADLAASIATPRFAVVDDVVARSGDCSGVDLNAIAKGHVVDHVARRVMADGTVARLVVNAGGDLVHRGAGVLRVAVEDPHHPFDNAPPLTRIEVIDMAVATSGRARRWFEVGGRRWSRVLDPRTGQPVDHTASATVVAPDAATADVLATVASVLAPSETMAFAADLRAEGLPVSCLVVDRDGTQNRSDGWAALEVGP